MLNTLHKCWIMFKTVQCVLQCAKLSELGEECFVVTANVSNGWVGHIGTIRGDEFMDDRSQILYDFLNYCCGRFLLLILVLLAKF